MINLPTTLGRLAVIRITHPTTSGVHAPFSRIASEYSPALFPNRQPSQSITENAHRKPFCASIAALVKSLRAARLVARIKWQENNDSPACAHKPELNQRLGRCPTAALPFSEYTKQIAHETPNTMGCVPTCSTHHIAVWCQVRYNSPILRSLFRVLVSD